MQGFCGSPALPFIRVVCKLEEGGASAFSLYQFKPSLNCSLYIVKIPSSFFVSRKKPGVKERNPNKKKEEEVVVYTM